MSHRRAIIWLAAVALLIGRDAYAQSAGRASKTDAKFRRIIQVYDRETQEGIEGVDVVDRITGNSTKTSSTGHVVLVPEFVKASGALLSFRKVGYDSIGPIFLDPTSDTTLLVPMRRSAQSLPTVKVDEKYNLNFDAGLRAGFEIRCQSKLVTCFREDELRAHPASTLYDVIKKTSGTIPDCGSTINRNGGGTRRPTGSAGKTLDCLKMHRVPPAGTPVCIPTFYVDGFSRGYSVTTLDEIEGSLGPLEVSGMEVYLSGQSVPLRYSGEPGNKGCGAVVIWTK